MKALHELETDGRDSKSKWAFSQKVKKANDDNPTKRCNWCSLSIGLLLKEYTDKYHEEETTSMADLPKSSIEQEA